jgi:hypothetical protein
MAILQKQKDGALLQKQVRSLAAAAANECPQKTMK